MPGLWRSDNSPRVKEIMELFADKTLQPCHDQNPHGAGIAWREGGEVRWIKTNSVEEIHRLAQAKRGEIVIHFRIASVGGVCDELRHPFPVSKRASLLTKGRGRAVLFQNGTWGGYKRALAQAAAEGHELPEGRMSDARAAAFLCSIYGKSYLEKCAPSRWVYYSAKGTSIFGKWHKIDGVLYSNTYWRKVEPKPAQGWPESDGEATDLTPASLASQPPRELWDMSACDGYWRMLYRATPKPTGRN